MDMWLIFEWSLATVTFLVGLVALFVCWAVYGNPANFPALLREAMRPKLSYQQRVRIVGGFYHGYVGTLKDRKDASYRVDIDGVGREKIAIRHLHLLQTTTLARVKEVDVCEETGYPLLPPDERLRIRAVHRYVSTPFQSWLWTLAFMDSGLFMYYCFAPFSEIISLVMGAGIVLLFAILMIMFGSAQ